MFKQAVKSELSQISLTGVRSLVLLGLLIQAPRSLEEIKRLFVDFNIMDESNSYDILRIDINTLKAMGCEISRASKKTDFKYVLEKHPFVLKINKDEISILKKTFNKIKNKTDIETLVKYDELFEKLAGCVTDENIKQSLIGLCSLKSHNIEQIREYNKYCKANKILTIVYKSPASNEREKMEVATEKLGFKNDKVYIYGFDINKKLAVMLHIKRIVAITSARDNDDNYISEKIKTKFILKDFTVAGLEENEKIIEKNEKGYLIEGEYHNEFLAMQRILSFGSSCILLEPTDLKEKIVETLKKMKEIYNG